MTKNRITREAYGYSIFESARHLVNSTVNFDQGDLMYLDSGLLAKQAVGATGANFLGIATVKVVAGKYAPIYPTDTNAAISASDVPGPRTNVIAKLPVKSGDALTPGDKVYPDPASGAYHVTTTAGSLVAIGVYQGPIVASATSGLEIEVFLKQNRI
jgi:hypothetical protein